ncbi:MAG TPA: glycosyltransferase family 2 protein [Chitinophagaceae bacterium]|nr:glycosyltransferase family 2 protein [Chitinophagaceae bacterium]
MQLSIIIVNYNVRYFLEQCLSSVYKAIATAQLNAEVFVVDNNSTDGSITYLRPRFPLTRFIANNQNAGFAKANNQALIQATGEYVLFLNPDTILPEDIFSQTIGFLKSHPNAGALGVRMVDGSGRFLKESKRGLPRAWASFCKMSGLTALFPKSKNFSEYYLGHLDERVTQPADVQAGAFFMARRDILNKAGGFDERFFMYAEDIDLSYRIQQLGYVNYYFADSAIIHFKGESTRKDTRYVKLFYKAMHQFVQKHYRSGSGAVFSVLLKAAISLRSGASMLKRSRSANPPAHKQRISEAELIGDAATIENIKPLLEKQTILIRPGANTQIYCEGNSYSFENIITAIQQLPAGTNAMIHAAGSSSIVGSFNKDDQGLFLPFT